MHSKKPICGVLAVALCAGVSYDVARDACRRSMAEGRQRFGGRTHHKQRIKALSSLAVKFVDLTFNGNITLGNWVASYAVPGALYMVNVTGHVVAIRDGFVIDQFSRCHISQHTSRRKQVKNITRITGKGW